MNRANTAVASSKLPLWMRLLDAIFVTIAMIDFYQSLVVYPVVIIPALHPVKPVVLFLNAVVSVGTPVGMMIFFIRWQRSRRKGLDEGRRHAWCTGIIRYWIAVEIFNYGFAKVLGTQFAPAYFRADSTWGSLPGFDLTWNYFGYSAVFANIIAGIQLVGAGFLLFRRTSVLGVLTLLPAMVNIVFIDLFYGIPTGALTNACLFTAGLIYLLALQYRSIVIFLRESVSVLPPVRLAGWKNVLRLSLVLYAFGFIYFVTTTRQPAAFRGKWTVEQMVLNKDMVGDLDWLKNRKAWKHIYLEEYGRASFSPNPYVLETGRSMAGTYRVDEPGKTIRFSLHADTGGNDSEYIARFTELNAHSMHWQMTNQQDTIELSLTKVLPAGNSN